MALPACIYKDLYGRIIYPRGAPHELQFIFSKEEDIIIYMKKKIEINID